MKYVEPAFLDLLERFNTDYIDFGMIHYVDSVKEWNSLLDPDYLKYILKIGVPIADKMQKAADLFGE